MTIGELNKRVDIQAQTRISDGMGGWTVGYTTIIPSVAAAIWPVSANDQIQATQNMGIITTKIRIRYRSVMKSSWRIKYGNRYFAIAAPPIDLNEKHEFLDLLCKEAA